MDDLGDHAWPGTVTLLYSVDLERRRAATRTPELAALAASLEHDLSAANSLGLDWLPPEKAKLTRTGGRCPADGALLRFDPAQPRAHECPQCGAEYRDDVHYRWWIMNYHLWLAERAVHAAALGGLKGDPRIMTIAEAIVALYADRYLTYPNVDNVLGPTRLFFSTYLEAIWLLQIATALDLLEAAGGSASLGSRARDRIVQPSGRLIAEFNEGDSNRQVWNNAALAACGRLLGTPDLVERVTLGAAGLSRHLSSGLLADGTWYEGENYHLFAHRGLWYGVAIAEHAGVELPGEWLARFSAGFRTPFLTALPDLTFPARRDSQYGVSLRQWRVAESCELGVARSPDDERLLAALGDIYHAGVPIGDTGRARSTAEAEQNAPPVRLTRAELGWKSLLFARESLPPLPAATPGSALLAEQGFGVVRRNRGRVYVALDYGHSGAGHGHPDRLNLWLVQDGHRVLEDVGTGSYTSPALHWYRSTLAHNAPLVDGVSQDRVDGDLLGFDDRGGVGWIAASAPIATGVVVTRAILVLGGCLVDDVWWTARREAQVDLPVHADGELNGVATWLEAPLGGGPELTDGFSFLTSTSRASGLASTVRLTSSGARAWFDASGVEWWRAVAPGPPGSPSRAFYLQRTRGRRGRLRSVWTWAQGVDAVEFGESGITIRYRDGLVTAERTTDGAVRIRSTVPGIENQHRASPSAAPARRHGRAAARVPRRRPWDVRAHASSGEGSPAADGEPGVTFVVGEESYRRSELSWQEAGRPSATVVVRADRESLIVDVGVRNPRPVFAPRREDNPLDNEHPDTNSDGIQFYVHSGDRRRSWILVPEPSRSGEVRVTPRLLAGDAGSAPVARASFEANGWRMRIALPRDALAANGTTPFFLDLIVNLLAPERERRQGQLVLSGGRGDWVYLQGDRQDPDRALPFVLVDD